MKSLSEVKFEELEGNSFELVLIVEMLCELCKKPLYEMKKPLRRIHFSSIGDLQNLQNRARIHDRSEVDVENCRIFFYDHDFPGDVHRECIAKL